MKNRTSKNLFLISILLILIISCQYEEIIEHQHYQENVVPVQKMHLKDLLFNKKFNNSYSKLKNAKSKIRTDLANRSSIEDSFNFTIVDSTVKVMSDNNNTYYTLRIETDNKTDQKLENLVLLEETETETIGYIVKYNTLVTEDKSEQEIIDAGFSEIQPITVTTESSNRVLVITYTYSLCNGIPYDCGGSICGFGTGIMTIEIPEVGDDIVYDDVDPDNPGGGPSGSNTGDANDVNDSCKGCGDVATSPVFDEEKQNTPCDDLKELQEPAKQNINPELNSLKQQYTNAPNHEHGVQFKYDTDINPPVYSNIPAVSNGYSVNYTNGWNYRGGAHTHRSISYNMFSWADVKALSECYDYASPVNKPYVVNIMICFNNITNSFDTYAIKVDNYTTLQNAINTDWNNPAFYVAPSGNPAQDKEDKIKKIHIDQEKVFKLAFKNNPSLSNDKALELSFLQQFANYGISLYKINAATNKWDNLTLNTATNTVIPNPCP